MSDRKCQELVKWWLEPLLEGADGAKPVSHEKLAERYAAAYGESIDRRTVANAIRHAFRSKLVEFREQLMVPDSERDRVMEREITSKYHLDASIVVRCDDPTITSDQLHAQLGYHVARSIADAPGGYFRHGDRIGIGSGRAIHYFVDAFRSLTLNVRDITLMSLTGTVYPEQTIAFSEQLLDADINTVAFAKCFAQPTRVRTISYPIALDEVLPARRNTWLYDPELDTKLPERRKEDFKENYFSEHVPHHAFVGVGVLAGNHRLYQEPLYGKASTMLHPIRKKLLDLIRISERISQRYKKHPPYHPIADICHRLWFVEPPEGMSVTPSEREQMVHLINGLNASMLTVTKVQLSRIIQKGGNVVLIAGGEQKSLAIQRLLERKVPGQSEVGITRTLCTDAATAARLLAAT
jgi:DNA-binding transcriptional regulator LsrR (DeoR family)